MRIKQPPGIGPAGTIGLCVALVALGACAASDADSPVAGSAAPVSTTGHDDRGGSERETDAPAGADGASTGGAATRRAPGEAPTDGAEPTVAQPRPNSGITTDPLASGDGGGYDVDATAVASSASGVAAITPRTAPTQGTEPARTDRHTRPGAPGAPTTTNPDRRQATTASTTTASTTTTTATATPTTTTTTTVRPPRIATTPSTTQPSSTPPSPTAPTRGTSSASMVEAIALVNAARVEAGLAPLVDIASLDAAAEAHALDQASMRAMTHIGSDGSDPGDRIARSGFPATVWGENLAAGYGSAGALVDAWLGTDGDDRSKLLDPTFTAVGVASAEASDGTIYWTMVLAG